MCKQVSGTLLHMHKVFPTGRGKQMIVNHSVMSLLLCLCRGFGVYKGEVHMSSRLSSGYLG